MKFLSLSLFSIAYVSSLEIWDVLQADLTCCSQHSQKDLCENESGSSCLWIDENSDDFMQKLAASEEKSCVGWAYADCKEKNGLDACCAPGCTGDRPPALVGKAGDEYDDAPVPVCGQKVPTPEPTPMPISPPCELYNGYDFTGYPCQISGDPHTTQYSGIKHDFQGQPTSTNGDGQIQNSFYYVARCNGFDQGDMPFQIMATHYHWGTRSVSGVDYLTMELNTVDGVYFVYLSSSLAYYALNGPKVTKDFDRTMAMKPEAMVELQSGADLVLGERFRLTYTEINSNEMKLSMEIAHAAGITDQDANIFLYMKGQMGNQDGRTRMHYVYFVQDDLYKCATCGLCGDFTTMKQSTYVQLLQTCDGRMVEITPGWSDNHPVAYDVEGWTYEYYFYNNMCGSTYDISDNTDGLAIDDGCKDELKETVDAICQAMRDSDALKDCCDKSGDLCDNLNDDCKGDVCIIASDQNKTPQDTEDIKMIAKDIFADALEGVCAQPGFEDANDAKNMLPVKYLGCYKDASSRAMRHAATMNMAKDPPKCVELCNNAGYKYAGCQYGRECFCENDWNHLAKYGEQTDKARCSQYQSEMTGEGPGCFGGDWTQCIYSALDGQRRTYSDDMFMSRITKGNKKHSSKKSDNKVAAVDVSVGSQLVNSNRYLEMTMAGVVVMALVGGAVAYSKRNKYDKYMPVESSV